MIEAVKKFREGRANVCFGKMAICSDHRMHDEQIVN